MKKIFIFIVSLICFWAITASAAMTVSNIDWVTVGNMKGAIVDLAFDSSYAYEGESLTAANLGFDVIKKAIVGPKDGYSFEYDISNGKIKVLAGAPPIVYEEKHRADAAGQFTLDYPAAFIVSLVQSGGTPFPIIYSGATTVGSGYACLSSAIADGVRTGVSAYTPSVDYYVTYATQAWSDIYDLLVQNELLAGAATHRGTVSGNTIFGWGWAKRGGQTSSMMPLDYSDTADTNEVNVDFGNSGTSNSRLTIRTSTDNVYATYLKRPLLVSGNSPWLLQRLVNDEDATSGTSIMNLDKPLLLWLTSGYGFSSGDSSWQIADQFHETFQYYPRSSASGASEMYTSWGASASGVTITLPGATASRQVWAVYDSANATMTHATYLYGYPWEIPNLKPLEITNGTDLSDLSTVKAFFIGF